MKETSDIINEKEIICTFCHRRIAKGEKCVMFTLDFNIKSKAQRIMNATNPMIFHEKCWTEDNLKDMTRFSF